MITRSIKRISLRALIVDDELGTPTAEGRAARALVTEMQGRAIEVIEAHSAEDGRAVITSDSAIHALLIDWSLGDDKNHARARGLIEYVRSRNDKIPIFLLAERGEAVGHPGRSHGHGRRVHLDSRGHGRFRRRPRVRRDPPLPRSHDAAAGRGAHEVHAGLRILLAHARPPGRHGVSQVAGGPHLLRLLRREHAALGPVHQRG